MKQANNISENNDEESDEKLPNVVMASSEHQMIKREPRNHSKSKNDLFCIKIFQRLLEACKRKQLQRLRSLCAQIAQKHQDRYNKSKIDCVMSQELSPFLKCDEHQRTLFHYIAILTTTTSTSYQENNTSGHDDDLRQALQSIECLQFLTQEPMCDARKLWFAQDLDGLTILHMAVISCNLPLIKHLVYEHPYSVQLKPRLLDLADNEHHSALHWAIMTQNVECIQLLLESPGGIELVHQRDLNGASPLHYATQTTQYNRLRRKLDLMLRTTTTTTTKSSRDDKTREDITTNELGSNKTRAANVDWISTNTDRLDDAVTKQDLDDSTQATTTTSLDHDDHQDHQEILQLFLSLENIQIDCIDNDRRTPLLWAASSGNAGAIRLLTERGANLNASDSNELGPLHCAASHAFIRCLETLLTLGKERGIRVNQLDKLRCTPLFYAVLSGQIDCIEILLDFGSTTDWQDARGRTAAHFAALKGHLGALKLLEARGANLWLPNRQGDLPLHYAVKSGRQSVIHWLIEHSPYERAVNAINNFGRAPIHLAIGRDKPDLLAYLIDRGANLNQLVKIRQVTSNTNHNPHQSSLFYYETAHDLAKRLGRQKCLSMLVEHQGLPAAQIIRERKLAQHQRSQSLISSSTERRHFARSLFDLHPIAGGVSPIGLETSSSSGTSGNSPSTPLQHLQGPANYGGNHHQQNHQWEHETEAPSSQAATNRESATTRSRLTRSQSEPKAGSPSVMLSSERPIKGGISYNNDRINASIKCKFYDLNATKTRSNKHQNKGSNESRYSDKIPPGTSGDHQQAASRTVLSMGGTGGEPSLYHAPSSQEIVTNVNVYTSPCPHCIHQQRCSECLQDLNANSLALHSAPNCHEPERAAGISSTGQEANECPARSVLARYTNNDHVNQQQQPPIWSQHAMNSGEQGPGSDGLPMLARFRNSPAGLGSSRPMLALEGGPARGSGGRVHLPPSQAHEQSLPTIVSGSERGDQSDNNSTTSADSATTANDSLDISSAVSQASECSAGEHQARTPASGEPDSGYQHHHQPMMHQRIPQSNVVPQSTLPSRHRGLDEEPLRFDRAPLRASRPVSRSPEKWCEATRSPVAEYIATSRSPVRGQRSQAAHPQQQHHASRPLADFSHVQAKVESRRQTPHAASDSQPAFDPGNQVRSVSRQTVTLSRGVFGGEDRVESSARSPIKTINNEQMATQAEKSVRRFWQESKLFEELQNLKRSQIRSGRACEPLLVKRLVERFHRETLEPQLIGLESYRGPYSFESYERYLYQQLSRLSHLSLLNPRDDMDAEGDEYETTALNRDPLALTEAPHQMDELDAAESKRLADEDLSAELELRRVLQGDGSEDHDHKQEETGDQGHDRKPARHEEATTLTEGQIATEEVAACSANSSRRSSVEVERQRDADLPLKLSASDSPASVSRAGSCSDLADDLSERVIDDALGNVVKFPKKSKIEPDEPQVTAAAGRRRKSIVNIGNKLEIIYHRVGIEIEPADELNDEAAPPAQSEPVALASTATCEQTNSAPDLEHEPEEEQRDAISEIQQANNNDSNNEHRDNEKESQLEPLSRRTSSLDEPLASEADSGLAGSSIVHVEPEKPGQTNVNTEDSINKSLEPVDQREGAEEPRRNKNSIKIGKQATFLQRFCSLPSSTNSSRAPPLTRSQNSACISLESAEPSANFEPDSKSNIAQFAPATQAQSQSEGDRRKVYTGHDLDRMMSERRRPVQRAQQKRPAHSKSRPPRRARSRLPSQPLIINVPIDQIKDRWRPIKKRELRRKRRMNSQSNNDFAPHQQLDQHHWKHELSGEKMDENRQEFVLIYELAKGARIPIIPMEEGSHREASGVLMKKQQHHSMDQLHRSADEPADSRADSRTSVQASIEQQQHDNPSLSATADQTQARVLLCQKKLVRIIDVRTLRRRMSLPESLLYSNDLLKKFNILKI